MTSLEFGDMILPALPSSDVLQQDEFAQMLQAMNVRQSRHQPPLPPASRKIWSAGEWVPVNAFGKYTRPLHKPLFIDDCYRGCIDCKRAPKRARIWSNIFITVVPTRKRTPLPSDVWEFILSFLYPVPAARSLYPWGQIEDEMFLGRLRRASKHFSRVLAAPALIRPSTIIALQFFQNNKSKFTTVVEGTKTPAQACARLESALRLPKGTLLPSLPLRATTFTMFALAALLCHEHHGGPQDKMYVVTDRTLDTGIFAEAIRILRSFGFQRHEVEPAFLAGELPALRTMVSSGKLNANVILSEVRQVFLLRPLKTKRLNTLRALDKSLPVIPGNHSFRLTLQWDSDVEGCLPVLPNFDELPKCRSVTEYWMLDEVQACVRNYDRFTEWVQYLLPPLAKSWGRQAAHRPITNAELQTRFLQQLSVSAPREFPADLPDNVVDGKRDLSPPDDKAMLLPSAFRSLQHHREAFACCRSTWELLDTRETLVSAAQPCQACSATPCKRLQLPMGTVDLIAGAYFHLGVCFAPTKGTETCRFLDMTEDMAFAFVS